MLVRLILILLFTPISAESQNQSNLADTILPIKIEISEDTKVFGAVIIEESNNIYVNDSINGIRLFEYGDYYLSYYDSLNKGQWPYSDNWVTWPILKDCDCRGDQFSVKLSFVNYGNIKLMLLNWESASTLGNAVWCNWTGQQLWDLKKRKCYFDCVTKRSVEYSGRGTIDGQPPLADYCEIITTISDNRFEITTNDCDQKLKLGLYKFSESGFIRK